MSDRETEPRPSTGGGQPTEQEPLPGFDDVLKDDDRLDDVQGDDELDDTNAGSDEA